MASSRTHRIPVSLAIIVAVALAMAGILASSGQSSAGDGTKSVRGWVWDNMGNNVTGASIVVNIWNPAETILRATEGESTDEDGFYSLQFEPGDWFVGDLIEVFCTYNGDQLRNTITAVSSAGWPVQYVNFTYDYEIPEFGSIIGFVVAGGAIGAVALVALFATQRRRVRT
jgi:hypothetical protein